MITSLGAIPSGLVNDLRCPLVLIPEKGCGGEILGELLNLHGKKGVDLNGLGSLSALVRFRLSQSDCANTDQRIFLKNLRDAELLAEMPTAHEEKRTVSRDALRSLLLNMATSRLGLQVAAPESLKQLDWLDLAKQGHIVIRDKYLLHELAKGHNTWFASVSNDLQKAGLSHRLIVLTGSIFGKEPMKGKFSFRYFHFDRRESEYDHPRWISTKRFALLVDAGLLPDCDRSVMGLLPQCSARKLRQLVDRFLTEKGVEFK